MPPNVPLIDPPEHNLLRPHVFLRGTDQHTLALSRRHSTRPWSLRALPPHALGPYGRMLEPLSQQSTVGLVVPTKLAHERVTGLNLARGRL